MEYKTINDLNVFYREGTSDEFVIQETFYDQIFEKGFPEYKVKDNDVVIDIGAHIGTYSLVLSQQLKSGTIYAFEPCLDTFTYLQKNVSENKIANIIPLKIALSDSIGTTTLFYDIENGNWGHSIVKSFSSEGEVVETNTLTNFFEANNISNCDFIKFNCEGAEFKILLSTPVDVLKKIKYMLVLFHLDLTDEYSIEQLLNHLHAAGLYTEIRQRSFDSKRGWLIVINASFLRKTGLTIKRKIKSAKTQLLRPFRKIKRILSK
jgi:FkbM family methyltransferase